MRVDLDTWLSSHWLPSFDQPMGSLPCVQALSHWPGLPIKGRASPVVLQLLWQLQPERLSFK